MDSGAGAVGVTPALAPIILGSLFLPNALTLLFAQARELITGDAGREHDAGLQVVLRPDVPVFDSPPPAFVHTEQLSRLLV